MLVADLHIHSKDCSDGRYGIREILDYAFKIGINVISITDHDATACQDNARTYAQELSICYITGIEISIIYNFKKDGKILEGPLDILGYGFNSEDRALKDTLNKLQEHRKKRIQSIVELLNNYLGKDGLTPLTETDLIELQKRVGGSIGRPHLADLLIQRGYVKERKEAFSKYLEELNLPKYSIGLEEVSSIIRKAGGKVFLAHPGDPKGTSLRKFYSDPKQMVSHIQRYMLPYLDGLECWHSRHDKTTSHIFYNYAKENNLLATGGSDCHQNPIIMGTVQFPLEALKSFLDALGVQYGN